MGVVLALSVWAVVQATLAPDLALTETAAADGFRAQQKLFEIVRRGRGGRPHTVELSEREVNAFLARHVDVTTDPPLTRLTARLHAAGRAELAWQMPWKALVDVPPLSWITVVLPASWLQKQAWLSTLGRVQVERAESGRARRYLRFDVETFRLGRLRLPEIAMRILLDPSALRLLRTPLPEEIDTIRVDTGRVIVGTAP